MKPNKKFLDNLTAFLVRAKKETYASGELAKKIIEADGSTSLIYEEIGWKYHDNYFGGEPFGGREVVSCKGKAVFLMTYYGKVLEHVSDFKPVYEFLQKALSQVSEKSPFRGPSFFVDNKVIDIQKTEGSYVEDNFAYFNSPDGDIRNFCGNEIIIGSDVKVFEARYCGGLINLRK